MTVNRAMYRTRQFIGVLRPRVRRRELREVEAMLGPQLMPLFKTMLKGDQRHCIDVYTKLREWGCEDTDVLRTALLHDAGKGSMAGGRVRLWHRVAYVLLEATAPGRGKPAPVRWLIRRNPGLRAMRDHGKRGVVLAEAFGASAEVVHLMQEMEHKQSSDPRVTLLREADEAA
jgi:hypothetical protein